MPTWQRDSLFARRPPGGPSSIQLSRVAPLPFYLCNELSPSFGPASHPPTCLSSCSGLSLGKAFTHAERDAIFDKLDVDRSGTVSFSEFLPWYKEIKALEGLLKGQSAAEALGAPGLVALGPRSPSKQAQLTGP